MSRRRKTLFSLTLLLIFLGMVIVAGEVLARIISVTTAEALPPSHPSHCLNRDGEDNTPAFHPACRIPGHRFNRYGFRSRDVSDSLRALREGLMIIGESVAFGWGASDNETTFGQVLESHLGPERWLVSNAGVPGSNLARTIAYYQGYAGQFEHRLLLLFCGWNEIINSTLHPAQLAAQQARKAYDPSLFVDPLNYFRAKSRLFDIAYRSIYLPVRVKRNQQQPVQQSLITAFKANLEVLITRQIEGGRQVILLTLPTYLTVNIFDRLTLDDYYAEVVVSTGIFANPRTLVSLHETYNRVIREMADTPGIILVDLDAALGGKNFEERRSLFAGDIVHLNDQGNRWIAGEIFEKLTQHGIVDSSQSSAENMPK